MTDELARRRARAIVRHPRVPHVTLNTTTMTFACEKCHTTERHPSLFPQEIQPAFAAWAARHCHLPPKAVRR